MFISSVDNENNPINFLSRIEWISSVDDSAFDSIANKVISCNRGLHLTMECSIGISDEMRHKWVVNWNRPLELWELLLLNHTNYDKIQLIYIIIFRRIIVLVFMLGFVSHNPSVLNNYSFVMDGQKRKWNLIFNRNFHSKKLLKIIISDISIWRNLVVTTVYY